MIWKTIDVVQEASAGKEFISSKIHSESTSFANHNSVFKVGIVGGGPKGLYALEELFSRIKEEQGSRRWEIFWWNKTEDFGSGPNYQVEQPDYLLINYCIGHIDAWDRTRKSKNDYLNFPDWITKFKIHNIEVKPTDYASRALVGRYLQYVTMQVINYKPENVYLRLFAEEVRNIQSDYSEKLIIQSDNHELCLDNLVLCTGHSYNNLPLVDFSENLIPENYLINAYPIEHLNKIQANKNVGIIGWGLTFIDVALQLSEGRGGCFKHDGNYIPSGNEPVLLPFSRNQLPIMPRGPIFGENTYKLHYINQSWLEEMKSIGKQRKINFTAEIFPWLEKEIQFAYYSTMLQTKDVKKVESYILLLPEFERFKAEHLLFPQIPKHGTLKMSYISYLDFLIAEAEKGELKSPLMAAAAVWREASPMITMLYSHGGFTGESQQYLDKKLFGAFCRTSYGPPIENMKKIKALLKADILQVHWDKEVKVMYDKQKKQFLLQAEKINISVDYIVDARIARPNLQLSNSNLYQNLYKNNLVNPYDNEGYRPGCVDMNANGKILQEEYNISMYVYGSNSEGFLLDNDSLSRTKNNLICFWSDQIGKQIQHIS